MPPDPSPTSPTPNNTAGAATAVISAWLAQHPDLAADLKGSTEATFRATVTSFLHPYDRFPSTLDALLHVALEQVDWESVFTHIGRHR